MKELFLLPLVIAFCVAVVAAYVAGETYRRRRGPAFVVAANRMGLSFRGAERSLILKETKDIKFYTEGAEGLTKNLMRGKKDGFRIEVFEYDDLTQEVPVPYVVAVLSSSTLQLPQFVSYLKGTHLKVGTGVSFPSGFEFSARLASPAVEAAVRNAITRDVQSYLADLSGITVAGSGNVLLVLKVATWSADEARFSDSNWLVRFVAKSVALARMVAKVDARSD